MSDIPTGWISVQDKLPDDVIYCELFLIYSKNPYFRNKVAEWDDGHWYVSNGEYADEVTHWMPLPKPPREAVQ
jgi:IMP cyclohydrolase